MAIVKFLIVLCLPMLVQAADFEIHTQISFPGGTKFENTQVGGISGLAYDDKTKTLIALSDDRGEHGEPRFFEFAVNVTDGKFSLKLEKTVFLKVTQKRVDFEAVTILPSGNLLISSEGDQNFKPRIAPEILEYTRDGKFVRNWDVASDWLPSPAGQLKSGVRNNRGIEAMALSPNQELLFVSPESSLAQQAPGKIQGRIYKNGKPWSVCSYELNSVDGGFVRGISEALWRNDQEVWVLERSLQADLTSTAELYRLPVKNDGSCGPRERVVDLAKNSSKLANFEGMTWGPTVKVGYRSLIVVSDNNFVLNLPTEFHLYLVKE